MGGAKFKLTRVDVQTILYFFFVSLRENIFKLSSMEWNFTAIFHCVKKTAQHARCFAKKIARLFFFSRPIQFWPIIFMVLSRRPLYIHQQQQQCNTFWVVFFRCYISLHLKLILPLLLLWPFWFYILGKL